MLGVEREVASAPEQDRLAILKVGRRRGDDVAVQEDTARVSQACAGATNVAGP